MTERKTPPAQTPALRSDPPETLAAALAALQSALPTVRKGETASVRSDKGSYSYDYADLEDCTKAIMPLMGPLGLSFSAKPTVDADNNFVLRYTLRHVSGEEDSGIYPLPDPTRSSPQQVGSAITYARRYTLCAVTGLAPGGDDDDGAAAHQAPRQQQASNGNGRGRQQQQRQQPPATPPAGEGSQEPLPSPPAEPAEPDDVEKDYEARMEAALTPRSLADVGGEIAGDMRLTSAQKARLQPLFTRRMQALNEGAAATNGAKP